MDASPHAANAPRQEFVSVVRNILISFGAFWLSFWIVFPLSWPLDRFFNWLGIVYSESVFSAIAMGVVISRDRTLAAVFAGVLVALVIPGRRSQHWALIVAALYAIDFHTRVHWALPPTAWDRLELRAERFFPAVACVVAVFVTAYVRRKMRAKRESSATQGPVNTSN